MARNSTTERRESRLGRQFVAAFSILAIMSLVLVAPAQSAARRLMGGWIPYWSTSESLRSFVGNADLFADVSPFWHTLTSVSSVSDQQSPEDRSRVVSAVRAAGVRLVPSVTDGTGTGQLAAALADPTGRTAVVGTLAGLVNVRGYDGIDLNFEAFAFNDGRATWPTTLPNWVAFVTELGARLHADGKVLYATIPPTYDSNRSPSSGYWVYDYAGIAPHVDRVRIMAYDYSVGSPGPIAPYDWVKRIAAYAVTQVPSWKVALGVPAYGRDWVTAVEGTCPAGTDLARKSVTGSGGWTLASAKGVAVQWDSVNREQTFSYVDTISSPAATCRVTHKVYFADARAVVERARLLDTYQLAGIAEWTVGGEDTAQWDLLRVLAANPWDPRVAPQEVLEAYVRSGYQDVLGRAADPSGLQTWTAALRRGQLSRTGFMEGLIYSPEGASRTVSAMYQQILGRNPDPSGLSGWTSAVSRRQILFKYARVAFWSSAERAQRPGGTQSWAMDLYSVELGRTADPGGLANWVSVADTQGRDAAARGIIGSSEWARRQVTAQYQLMLKRQPDPSGLESWTSVLLGTDLPVVQASLGASDEYFMRANP